MRRTLLLLILPAISVANESVHPEESVEDARLQVNQDPTFSETDTGYQSQVSVEATTEGSQAKLRIGSKFKKKPTNRRSVWSVVVEGKLDSKDKTARLGDLDGLNDDVTVSYGHTWLAWKPAGGTKFNAIRRRYCEMDYADRGLTFNRTDICAREEIRGPNAERYRREWENEIYGQTPLNRFSLTGKLGYSSFKFFDAMDLSDDSVRELSYSAAFTYSRLGNASYSWFLGTRYERAFKDNSKVQRCNPGPVAGALVCEERPLGPPARKSSKVAFVEWRRFSSQFVVSPKLSYDIETSTLGVQIPIWLATDAKRNFTGGLRLDWNNDDDDAMVSVFISAPLSVLAP